MPPAATPASRNSMGTKPRSVAYFNKNATPTKSTMMPTRTSVLPPKKKFQIAEGSREFIGAALELYEKFEFSKAIESISALIGAVDKYIVERAPWKLAKDGRSDEAARVGSECLDAFKVMTACLKPVLPALAQQAEAFLNIAPLTWDTAAQPMGPAHAVEIGRAHV